MPISSNSFDMAVKFEQEGYDYYKKHAGSTENPFVVSVLEKLAEREEDHIRVIKELAEGKKIEEVDLEKVDLEKATREVFEEFSESEREGWKEEKASVYDHALELETKLAELYKEMAKETDDEDEEEFFKALMKEEDKHYETLQNVFYYLTDHDRWMAEKEGEIWGWMNT
ncbi:ferritin family protein [Candidatus Bipolaricaulota bacterium]|nr:ferritin family protein [Candidatus Bipolaricaulota bacterium]